MGRSFLIIWEKEVAHLKRYSSMVLSTHIPLSFSLSTRSLFIQIRSELEGQELYNNNIINKQVLRLRTAAGADVCVHKAAYTLE